MLDLIARHQNIIKAFHVDVYEQEGNIFRFKAQIIFINESKLFVKQFVFENEERKYAYHWIDNSGNMICRWDNANHWPEISTSPHHKHIGNKVSETLRPSVILSRIIVSRLLCNHFAVNYSAYIIFR